FVPTWRRIPLAVQLVVPVAVPLPPRLFAHVTWVTPTLSAAVPASVRGELLVLRSEERRVEVKARVGGLASASLTVKLAGAVLTAASCAVTVSTFVPS